MKKKFILMLTLLAGVLSANADNVVSIGNADIPQNGIGFISINLDNTDDVASFQFDVTLPTGVSFVTKQEAVMIQDPEDPKKKIQATDEGGNPIWRDVPVGETTIRTSTQTVESSMEGQKGSFLIYSGQGVTGNSGSIIRVKVSTDGSLTSGEYEATLGHIVLALDGAIKDDSNADKNFDLALFDGVVLDEESTEDPAKVSEVNVKVLRTIKAGEWSTICLPFDMDEDQVKAAFGDDVELKEFDSAEASEEAISIKFTDADEIEKETPYLIKVGSDISSFIAENVNINGKSTKVKTEGDGGTFRGTFKVKKLDEETVFISNNKFYYSKGLTNIKGFRCWFEFDETLAAYDESRSIEFEFIDGTTGINNAVRQLPNDGNYYNLKGQRVEKPSKGVFIVNGKKVVVK